MFPFMRFCRTSILCAVLCSLTSVVPLSAAMDPRFELDAKTLGATETSNKQPSAGKRASQKSRKSKSHGAGAADGTVYTVKSGDNLFKILIRDYGFSDDEAETFINIICRENNIPDIRRLRVGQKIVIPALRRTSDKKSRTFRPLPSKAAVQGTGGMKFMLESPDAALSELEANVQFKRVWDMIVPPKAGRQSADMINSPSYSLTLDPMRYPIYAAMDGGRILVDRNDTIPPLVKALIVEKNPSVRIVSESPLDSKRFLKGMLDSAGFYSVMENFSVDFGSDPKLTVYSDFKIEKSSESIINFDVVLMNSGRTPYPRIIKDYLKNEGMTAYEPFASLKPGSVATGNRLYQITSKNQTEIVDALLVAMSINPDRNKRLDVFAAEDNGILLSVNAERYFERNGLKHVITRFDGDPITYTLYRILEAKGYQTVILDGQDDFFKITEKLLSGIGIQGTYARHKLGPHAGVNYSLQMSGFRIGDEDLPASDLFLTNLEFDRVIRDLLLENGYRIIVK